MEVAMRYKLFTLLYTAYIHHSVVLSQYSHCLLFLMFWSKKASMPIHMTRLYVDIYRYRFMGF